MIRSLVAAVVLGSASLMVTNSANDSVVRAQGKPALPDVLTKATAQYSTLTSYADTGKVVAEMPGIVDESRFTTYFRRGTRDLYFDYQALTSTNPQNKFTIDMKMYRYVVWMFKGEMQKYDFKTQAHDIVAAEGGGQVQALQSLTHATQGTSILVPSMLYSQARLPSTILQIDEASATGFEEVNKRRCHKIIGIAAAYYPSGQRTNVRPVTVWIDAETQLIRKVFEDTPKSAPAGSYSRLTITLEPLANPGIEDAKFQFKVPGQ